MSLDQRTLDLLTAKESFLEIQWLSSGAILYLEAGDRDCQLWLKTEVKTEIISRGLSLGSPLPYGGQITVPIPSSNQLLTLGRDGKVHDLTSGRSRDLPGPSSDLTLDASDQASCICFDPGMNSDTLYANVSSHPRKIWTSPAYLRQLQWHPSLPLCLFLSWPRESLPWHKAELALLDARDPAHPAAERLSPPGLDHVPCAEASFSPNGKYLAASFLTGHFFQLWLLNLKTKNWVQLTFDNREKSSPLRRSGRRNFAFLNDQSIVYTSSDKGYWRLDTIDFHGHAKSIKSSLSHFTNIQSLPHTSEVLALGAGIEYPPQILKFASKGTTWTSQRYGEKLNTKLRSEPITWATDTGETVHGILYRDRSSKKPGPLIIPVHGGPTDAVHATWPSKAIAFVQKGFAVLYVNYRGSWGYGFDYHKSLAGHWGDREIKDCVSAVRSLADLEWIDPKRVGIWGGGTASFTVLRALIQHPDVFHAGIAVFPILDLVHHLALCSPAEKTELAWALGTLDPLALAEKSPVHAIDRIRRPLALFAGADDPLIDKGQLQNFADTLKGKNVPCWLSIYENEGRTWRNHATYTDYYSRVSGFFDRFLRFRSVD